MINPVVDLHVGDEVTKINGQSVRNSTTSTIVAIDDATRMLERVSWRETGRGFAVLSVRRHLRKGSPTGGAHGGSDDADELGSTHIAMPTKWLARTLVLSTSLTKYPFITEPKVVFNSNLG